MYSHSSRSSRTPSSSHRGNRNSNRSRAVCLALPANSKSLLGSNCSTSSQLVDCSPMASNLSKLEVSLGQVRRRCRSLLASREPRDFSHNRARRHQLEAVFSIISRSQPGLASLVPLLGNHKPNSNPVLVYSTISLNRQERLVFSVHQRPRPSNHRSSIRAHSQAASQAFSDPQLPNNRKPLHSLDQLVRPSSPRNSQVASSPLHSRHPFSTNLQ